MKQGESYMSECPRLRSASGKVLSLHKSIVSCGCTEWNSVAFIVSAHSDEPGAPCDLPLKMVDV